MQKYRISKNRDEIIKLVQKKFESEHFMTMWQKDPVTELRIFRCEVKFSSLDVYEGIFSVEIDAEQRKNFNPKLETYFLLQIQDFVFKTKASVTKPKKPSEINFQIPRDVRLKELRIHPRVYIEAKEKVYVSATFEGKDEAKPVVNVACPVYNISKSGICIIVSKETLSNIKLDEAISLAGLNFFESLTNEMKAVVKNARVYTTKGYSSDDQYALGLEFQG